MVTIDRGRLFLLAFLDALGILWPLLYLLVIWGSRERKGGPVGPGGVRMAGIQVKPERCPECGAKMTLDSSEKDDEENLS